MSITRIQPLVEGIIIATLGIAILILIPSQIEKIPGMATQMSPSFFPVITAIALIILGSVLIYQSFSQAGKRNTVDISQNAILRVILAIVLLVAYTYLFQYIGFVVTSALFFAIFAYIFGSQDFLKVALSMILIPVVVWLFFEILFRIPLPHGMLF